MKTNQAEILKNLEDVRTHHGEAAYTTARDNLIRLLIGQANGELFLKSAFPEVDLEPFKKAASLPVSPVDFLGAVRSYVPNLRTQAQLDLFMAAFDLLSLTFDRYLSGSENEAAESRKLLDQTLDTALRLKGLEAQVREMPEEDLSAEAQKLVNLPKEFSELNTQRELMRELGEISTPSELSLWYQDQKERLNSVVSRSLRDPLFDAIRVKRSSFAN